MTELTFMQLKKAARKDTSHLPQYKVALMGDCATQHLATALRGCGFHAGLGLTVLDTDYAQIDAQTMDPGSELYAFAPDAVLIQMCTEKLYRPSAPRLPTAAPPSRQIPTPISFRSGSGSMPTSGPPSSSAASR